MEKEMHLSCCPRMTEGNFPIHDVYQLDFKKTFLGNFRRLQGLLPDRETLHSRSGFTNQKEFINKTEYDINLTYEQCGLIINALATLMKEQFDLRKGDYIGIIARNSPFWLLLDLAVSAIGGVLVPLYDTLGPEKLAYCANLAKIKIVFTQEQNFGTCLAVSSKVPSLKHIVCIDGIKNIVMEFSEIFYKNIPSNLIEERKKYLKNRDYPDYNETTIINNLLKCAIPIFVKHFYIGEVDISAFPNSLSDDAISMYSINFSQSSISPIENVIENETGEFNVEIVEQMRKFDINNFEWKNSLKLSKKINNNDAENSEENEEKLHIFYLHPLLSYMIKHITEVLKLNVHEKIEAYTDEKVELTDNTKIIFTSGSSGPPKGVVHTFKSLMHGAESTFYRAAPIGFKRMCEYSTKELIELQELSHELYKHDDILCNKTHKDHKEIYEKFMRYNKLIGQDSKKGLEHTHGYHFMPLAHCYDSVVELNCISSHPLSIFYLCVSPSNLAHDLGLTKPDLLLGVPRVFTKISAGIDKKLSNMPKVVSSLFRTSIKFKNLIMKYNNYVNITGKFPILDKTIFKSVHQMLGGNLKVIVSGSAAIPNETIRLLKAISCSTVMQGFGMSESAAGGSVSPNNQCFDDSVNMDSMGVASPGVLAKVIDRSDICEFSLERDHIGELLTKGPCMASHYLSKNETLCDKDGWYHTGDLIKIITKKESISVDPKTKIGRRNRVLLRSYLGENLPNIDDEIDFSKSSQYIDADKIILADYDPTIKEERKKNNLPLLKPEEEERLRNLLKQDIEKRHKKIHYDKEKKIITYDVDNWVFVRRAAAVVKTQCGEFLDLELIENTMENSPLFTIACVDATADKSFPVAIVSVDSNVLLSKLNELNNQDVPDLKLKDIIEYHINYTDGEKTTKIISESDGAKYIASLGDQEKIEKFKRLHTYIKPKYHNKVRDILTSEASMFIKKSGLNGYCCPKTFYVTFDDDWNDPILLTATMKKQRKGIISYFNKNIKELYAELAEVDQKGGSIQIGDNNNKKKENKDTILGMNKYVISAAAVASVVILRAAFKAIIKKYGKN